jgi:hypothetical protein
MMKRMGTQNKYLAPITHHPASRAPASNPAKKADAATLANDSLKQIIARKSHQALATPPNIARLLRLGSNSANHSNMQFLPTNCRPLFEWVSKGGEGRKARVEEGIDFEQKLNKTCTYLAIEQSGNLWLAAVATSTIHTHWGSTQKWWLIARAGIKFLMQFNSNNSKHKHGASNSRTIIAFIID